MLPQPPIGGAIAPLSSTNSSEAHLPGLEEGEVGTQYRGSPILPLRRFTRREGLGSLPTSGDEVTRQYPLRTLHPPSQQLHSIAGPPALCLPVPFLGLPATPLVDLGSGGGSARGFGGEIGLAGGGEAFSHTSFSSLPPPVHLPPRQSTSWTVSLGRSAMVVEAPAEQAVDQAVSLIRTRSCLDSRPQCTSSSIFTRTHAFVLTRALGAGESSSIHIRAHALV